MANFAASPHLFQPLANPRSCIAALYAKSTVDITSKCCIANVQSLSYYPTYPNITRCLDHHCTPATAPVNTLTLICPEKCMETISIQKPLHILKLPTACSATSPNFYLPPRYETPTLDVNISLNMANLHMLNILAQDFCIWQHLGK